MDINIEGVSTFLVCDDKIVVQFLYKISLPFPPGKSTTCRVNFVGFCSLSVWAEAAAITQTQGTAQPFPLILAQISDKKMRYIPDGYMESIVGLTLSIKLFFATRPQTHLRDLTYQRNQETEFSALSQHEMDKLCT